MFEKIVGNTRAKKFLQSLVERERIPHALLFTGIEGIGKSLFAYEMASFLLETTAPKLPSHPDFHVIVPDGKNALHSIEKIREMITTSHQAPYEGKAKVFVIENMEKMLGASANALLKTLEEPTDSTYFFCLSSKEKEILPTIISRCLTVRFQPLLDEEIISLLEAKGVDPEVAKRSEGSVSRAIELGNDSVIEEKLFSILAGEFSLIDRGYKIKEIEDLLGKEEDPIIRVKEQESLFKIALMWWRDQEARKWNKPLFFPSAPPRKGTLPPFQKVEEEIQKARQSLERNIKLSICLERIVF